MFLSLRYYYAVVECDSSATADYLYKVCDGVEFERSSNKLDLRFIPDSMEFKHPPRDVAREVCNFFHMMARHLYIRKYMYNEGVFILIKVDLLIIHVFVQAPTNYGGLDFYTKALQHSNVHLSWDDDEPERSKTLKRKYNADQVGVLDLELVMSRFLMMILLILEKF